MGRKILAVEDDRNISDLIRMYLEKEGFEVTTAFDGGTAVERFREIGPDLVLLDIMLPVMDGWSVCAKIRETSRTPIIMLTAKSEVLDRVTGLEMGADDYLVKPFEMKELIARINAVLRRTEIPDDTRKRLTFDKLVIDLDSYELTVTRCGASTTLATAAPWTCTSSASGRRWKTSPESGPSRPFGVWATSLRWWGGASERRGVSGAPREGERNP